MDDPTRPDHGLSWRSALTILVFGATLMTVRLGPGWVLTYHEVNFSQPAREFLEAGDWLVPRMLGEANFQKPALTSWLIAAAIAITGSDAEWVVRLPSLAADLVAALALATLAARWYGDWVGRLAGLIHLTTFYCLFQARLAEADMPLCAAVIVGMLCYSRAALDGPEGGRASWGWTLAYFASAVAAFHIKGPIGLAFVGLPCGAFAILDRRWRAWRPLLDPVGWLVLIVGCAGYVAMVALRDPKVLEDLRVHNLDRFTGAIPHRREGPFYYLYMGPLIFLPWTPLLFPGIRALLHDPNRPRDFWRLLGCWVGVILVLISLSAWKHKHYAIPALPPLAIVAALGMARLNANVRPTAIRTAALGGLAALAACAGAAAWGLATGKAVMLAVAPALGVGAAGALLVAWTRKHEHLRRWSVAGVFATTWLVVVLVQSLVLPLYDRYRPQAELAARLDARRATGDRVDLVALIDPQVLWYVSGQRAFTREVDEYVRKVASERAPEGRLIVTPAASLPGLSLLGPLETIAGPVPPHGLTAVRLVPDRDRLADLRAGTEREGATR